MGMSLGMREIVTKKKPPIWLLSLPPAFGGARGPSLMGTLFYTLSGLATGGIIAYFLMGGAA